MKHFSHADEPEGVAEQLERFKGLTVPIVRRVRWLILRAVALSCDAQRNGCVPASMLYGASPFADTNAQQFGLRPVMTLTSEIISVRELKKGDRVGYAGLFRADKTMRIGTVAAAC